METVVTWLVLIALAASIVGGVRNRRVAWLIPIVTLGTFAALLLLFEAPWWVFGIIGLIGAACFFAVVKLTSAVVLATIASVLLLIIGLLWLSPPDGEATTSTPSKEAQEALTVTTVEYNCATDANGLAVFDIKALKPVGDGGRKWSDAVSTPFGATEPRTMLDEIKAEMCTNPHFGAMVGHFFANLRLGSFAVADVNPWLNEFKGDPVTVVHIRAVAYVPLLDKQNPTDEEVATAAARNRDWQGVAERLNTLLGRFTLGEVQAEQSALNYHLVVGGVVAGQLPPVELNPRQESLSALQLYLTEKGRAECLAKVGFNTGDKRVEQFACTLPPGFTPPGSSTTNPGCEPDCQTTTTPPGGCKPGECVTTTPPGCPTCSTTTTVPPKDATNMPRDGEPNGGVRTTEVKAPQPHTPPPAQPRTTDPAPPANTGSPGGSTSTQVQVPTTEVPMPTTGAPPGDPGDT